MHTFWRDVLKGMGQVLDLGATRSRLHPVSSPERAMQRDWEKVGRDFRSVFAGLSSDKTTSR